MRYLFFFSLLIYCANCSAQGASSNRGFTPDKNIIFEDSFSDDSLGHFPHKWKKGREFAVGTRSHAFVRQKGADKVLGTNFAAYLKPAFPAALTDSFTVECDFMLKDKDTTGWLSIGFCLDRNDLKRDVQRTLLFYYEDQKFRVLNVTNRSEDLTEFSSDRFDPPVAFACDSWYHLGLSYRHRHISCYLNSNLILDLPDCGFVPIDLFIGLRDSAICKHVVIANGKFPDFSRLITEKKFVTHSILFKLNRAVIGAESGPFLAQLAEWLIKNPGIRVEIDGHTDIDGSAASNLDLSVKRAEEVRKQLVAKGVPAPMLTTKGLGAKMPLRSNKTEEGRSENRRVEFLLLGK